MNVKALLTILVLTVSAYTVKAQSTTNDDKQAEKKDDDKDDNPVKVGVNFISNNVYLGRTNTTVVPIISPNLKYTLKSGIYFSGSVNILPDNKTKKVDGGDLSAGYDFNITDDLSGTVSYSKLLYTANSTIVGSSVSSVFNGGLDYDFGTVITASASFDYSLNASGIKNDKTATFGLSHDIIIKPLFADDDFLIISPAVDLNLGTQNFYSGFVSKKSFKSAKRTAAQNALVEQYQQTLNKFTLLDYELSIPVVYKTGHFLFTLVPTLAIAQNQFKSAAVANALALSSKTSVFYFTAGVAFKF